MDPPPKLPIQTYLLSGKSLDDLKIEHGVKSFVQNGKVSLSYDQIEARESDELSQQCRGLILRDGSFDIVAAPLFRFFNLEQGIAASIDWSSARFEEKLDGTLIIVYFDDQAQRWFCATRSRPEADVPVDDYAVTFTDLVNIALRDMFALSNINELMARADGVHQKTFCFEFCSPMNRIVCEYSDFKLTLLAVRDNVSLLEEDPQPYAKKLGVPVVETYSFSSITDLVEVIRAWDPKNHEGVVVKDANYHRIKVKSPAYVAFNHMRDSLSTSMRGCMEIVLLGKDDDVISMVPEFIGNRIKKLKPLVAEILKQTETDYMELRNIEDMKTYALAAQKKMWPACLFALKRGKTPNVLMFALGNDPDRSKLSTNAVDNMLALCEKIDPTFRNI